MKRILVLCLIALLAGPLLPARAQTPADLSAIKSYLLTNVAELQANTARLANAAEAYYALAETAGFDYAALWADQRADVVSTLTEARDAWLIASPLYEQVEGVVAGVPSLAEYDVILDAGASGKKTPQAA